MSNLVNEEGYITDPYRSFIHQSRYARWNEGAARRETWVETVDRFMDFMTDHLKKNNDYVVQDQEYSRVRQGILDMKVLPSMRAMMTAGPALEKNHIAAYNPVAGKTPVLTLEYGMLPIEKLSGTKATVLNKNGDWTEAEFKSYGLQQTYTVKLRKNTNTFVEVDATANHRWLMSDGDVLFTSNLKPGMRIPYAVAEKPDANNIDYKLGVIHGLVYGDGTATYSQERLNGYYIRLCSDAADLLPYFLDHGKVCYPPSANGDPVVMLYGAFAKTHELKRLPEAETPEYVLGFMRGWMAADGSIGKNSHVTLAVTAEGLEWFDREATKVGFVKQNVYEYSQKTNFGDRKKRLFCLTVDRSSCVVEDFIIERKREKFIPMKSSFTVVSVMESELQEVFCAEVPDTNTFVLEKGLVTGNCSALPIDSPRAFDEVLYVLMHGTGVGFSVESKFVDKLPVIPDELEESETVITVADSKEGWQKGFKELIAMLYVGQIPSWNLSKIREKGAKLKTFGGRASGPEPLDELFRFTVDLFTKSAGRRLKPLEAHDLVCKIAEIVVVGGVRRSALISLSDLQDQSLAKAKTGEWWTANAQRALSNNSAVYEEKPSIDVFLREWTNLYESKSGERGIFNREAAAISATRSGRRDGNYTWLTNPCSEINLRPNQFCNLSTVVVNGKDTEDELMDKVELATILGTWQSTLVNFKGLRPIWKKNTEEERLLGVSMTGIFGNAILNGTAGLNRTRSALESLRYVAIEINKQWADKLGIPQSTAITCVKPEGTVSQLTKTSSGIHPWHNDFYVRTVRGDNKDPLTQFLKECGVPHEPDVTNDSNTVFSFPQRAPESALTRNSLSAIEHLELWLVYQKYWCEHKPSVTISVREEEWIEVAAWVYKNFDEVTGVSFLPHSDHTYRQAPYQDSTEQEIVDMEKTMPELDWKFLAFYEQDGSSIVGGRELACSAGACEVVDLVTN